MEISAFSLDGTQEFTVSNPNILDITALKQGKTYSKMCFCEQATCSPQKNMESFFIKFILRDLNGKRIVARQYGVDDIDRMTSVVTKIQKRIILVEFTVDYFHSRYLRVKQFDFVDEATSAGIVNKFMTKKMNNFDETKLSIEKVIDVVVDKYKVDGFKTLCNKLEVELRLSNLTDTIVEEGALGSKYKTLSLISDNMIQMYSVQDSYRMLLASYIAEAIIDENKSINEVFKDLILVDDFKSTYPANCELQKVCDLVTSYIYLEYNIQQPRYKSQALVLNTIRKNVRGLYAIKNATRNNGGVYTLGEYILEDS